MLLLSLVVFFGTTSLEVNVENILAVAAKGSSIVSEDTDVVSQRRVLPQKDFKRTMPLVSVSSGTESKSFKLHESAKSGSTNAQARLHILKYIESGAVVVRKKDVSSNDGETTPRMSSVLTDPNFIQSTKLHELVINSTKSNHSDDQDKKQVQNYTESVQEVVSEQEQMPKDIKQIHFISSDQQAGPSHTMTQEQSVPSKIKSGQTIFQDQAITPEQQTDTDLKSGQTIFQDQVITPEQQTDTNLKSGQTIFQDQAITPEQQTDTDLKSGQTVFQDQTRTKEQQTDTDLKSGQTIFQVQTRTNEQQTDTNLKFDKAIYQDQAITPEQQTDTDLKFDQTLFQDQTRTKEQQTDTDLKSGQTIFQDQAITPEQQTDTDLKSGQTIFQDQAITPEQQTDTDLKSGRVNNQPKILKSAGNAEILFHKPHQNNRILNSESEKKEKILNTSFSVSLSANSSRKEKTDINNSCEIYVVDYDTIANCSFRNLTSLQDVGIPFTVTHLFIQGNFLAKLRNNSFKNFTLLGVLDISRNTLSEVEELAFSGLEHLIVLDLSENNLRMTNATFPDNIFSSLIRLEELKLNKNNNSCKHPDGLDYPDRALSHLTSLKKLSMDGLYNKDFGPGFQKLTSLEHLSMAGFSSGCCNMNRLTNVTFRYLTQLKHLNISSCYIPGRNIDREAFSRLQNLISLDLTHNEDIDIESLDKVFYSLQNITTLKELRMKLIVNRYSIGICLDSFSIAHFPQHLEYFDAQENSLEGLDRQVIGLLSPSLKTLDVSGNKFVFGTYLQDLHLMKNLTELKVNGGGFVYKFPEWFPYRGSYKGSSANCSIYGQPGASVQNYTKFTITLPPNLKTIEMNSAGLKYILSNLTIDPNNMLKNLSMNTNTFPRLIGPFVGLTRLTYLDVSSSYVRNISNVFFTNLTSLKILKLGGNLLGDFFSKEESSTVFQPLKHLNYLDLSFNDIRSLPTNVFSSLGNLHTLLLAKNPFTEFNVSISNMYKLTLLNLTGSRISRLLPRVKDHIDALINQGQNVIIDMSQCPISCTCINLYFLVWIRTFGAFVNESSSYQCVYDDGSSRYITDGYNSTIDFLSRACPSQMSLFLSVTAAMVIVFCIILVSVFYRFRWKIRYLYYAAHLFYRSTKRTKESTEYEYDVFISYDEADEQFVVGKMSQELEKRGLKLCIHGRDFRAGDYIASNIVRAVCASRRTVVVLTRHMIGSYWCKYEIQMANMEAVHTGRRVLLFLLMETIPDGVLGVELLYYIRNSTYIPYPKNLPDATSIGKLWDKLVADILD